MKKRVFKKTTLSGLGSVISTSLLTVAVMAMMMYGLNQTEKSSRSEGLRILDESLRRAVAACYAVEGSYPDSIDYITEHYGVYIDTSRYSVYYDVFASNMLPEITVIVLGDEQ